LNRRELAEQYSDVIWQERLIEQLAIVTILTECIIRKNYKISDEMNNAIVLTEAGRRVQEKLVTKEAVPPKVARILTLLALVHVEPLVDFEKTSTEHLIAAISRDITQGAIMFPFIFGRELYDRAAELFPEERDYLRHEDTLKLLEGTSRGVFQTERFLVGPLGIIETAMRRSVRPRTRIPLQHCSDPSCAAIHRVQLTTSIEAEVNRFRPALNKVLDEISSDPSEWNGFVSDITRERDSIYADQPNAGIVNLIGDALDDEELKCLLSRALDGTEGRVRKVALRHKLSGRADEIVAGLGRDMALQLLLTETDNSLVLLLDEAVRAEEIVVPPGEVRRPKVNTAAFGAWRVRPEVSSQGFRETASRSELPLLRMSALARSLFDAGSASDMEELSWALRATSGETASERLEVFLRQASPEAVVEKLILARRPNVEKICRRMGIPLEASDKVLVHSVLWKLGFEPDYSRDMRDAFWSLHSALERAARAASVSASVDIDSVRSIAVNYFVQFEGYLRDAFIFGAWALLCDHYVDSQPFTFRDSSARESVEAVLDAAESGLSVGLLGVDAKPSLSDWVASFGRLAGMLRAHRDSPDATLRSRDSYPRFAGKTDLQDFPFLHTVPFLDLAPSAQMLLLEAVEATAVELNDSSIMTWRNSLLHASRTPMRPADLSVALEATAATLRHLEDVGLVPMTFVSDELRADRWGRATSVLRALDGSEVTFTSPSRYEWLGMPWLSDQQFLVRGAIFGPPNVMLRFRRGYESRYAEYWSAFPRRREPGNRIGASQSDSLATPLEAGAFVSSRAD
jgi:hypothetical protein